MDQAYELAEAAIVGVSIIGAMKIYINYKKHKDKISHETYDRVHEYELQVREKLTSELLNHGLHQSEIELILRNTLGPISRLDDIKHS